MTAPAPDRLQVLLDRACRGVASAAEAEQLRAAVDQLQQQVERQTAQLANCHTDIHAMAERIVDLTEDQKRTNRYRAAWQSARRRARLIPNGGQEVHDGTRWRPALQAYSVIRARLAKVEQQLAAVKTPEPLTHRADISQDPDSGEWNASCPDCPAYVDNIGDEQDANEWAERHRADATSNEAPR